MALSKSGNLHSRDPTAQTLTLISTEANPLQAVGS